MGLTWLCRRACAMGPSHCLMFKRIFYNEVTKIGRRSKVVNQSLIMYFFSFFNNLGSDLILMT